MLNTKPLGLRERQEPFSLVFKKKKLFEKRKKKSVLLLITSVAQQSKNLIRIHKVLKNRDRSTTPSAFLLVSQNLFRWGHKFLFRLQLDRCQAAFILIAIANTLLVKRIRLTCSWVKFSFFKMSEPDELFECGISRPQNSWKQTLIYSSVILHCLRWLNNTFVRHRSVCKSCITDKSSSSSIFNFLQKGKYNSTRTSGSF